MQQWRCVRHAAMAICHACHVLSQVRMDPSPGIQPQPCGQVYVTPRHTAPHHITPWCSREQQSSPRHGTAYLMAQLTSCHNVIAPRLSPHATMSSHHVYHLMPHRFGCNPDIHIVVLGAILAPHGPTSFWVQSWPPMAPHGPHRSGCNPGQSHDSHARAPSCPMSHTWISR